MLQLLKDLYRIVDDAHRDAVAKVLEVEPIVRKQTDLKELVDMAFALRETSRLADHLKKLCDNNQRNVENVCCARAVETGPDAMERIRTHYATAEPDVKIMPSLPKKGTEEFHDLLTELGVPDNLHRRTNPIVVPYWPGVVDYMTSLSEVGKPLPHGIDPDKTYPLYTLKLRKKRGVLHFDEEK